MGYTILVQKYILNNKSSATIGEFILGVNVVLSACTKYVELSPLINIR